MEEKKPIKMGLKVLIGILILITIIIVILFIYNSKEKVTERLFSETIKIKTYKNEDYYIITSDYMGEYDLQEKTLAVSGKTVLPESASRSRALSSYSLSNLRYLLQATQGLGVAPLSYALTKRSMTSRLKSSRISYTT